MKCDFSTKVGILLHILVTGPPRAQMPPGTYSFIIRADGKVAEGTLIDPEGVAVHFMRSSKQ